MINYQITIQISNGPLYFPPTRLENIVWKGAKQRNRTGNRNDCQNGVKIMNGKS